MAFPGCLCRRQRGQIMTLHIASLMEGVAIDLSESEEASSVDEQLSAVQSALQGQWPSHRSRTDERLAAFFSVCSELSSQEALIFHRDRLVVPVELRVRVLANAHAGHQGQVHTKQRLREHFWWPRMDADVHALIRECEVCSKHDEHLKHANPPLQPIQLPDRARQRVMLPLSAP